ncbi:LiaI-LiaF-like domain-containing protein [candidate division KSB1 bacterium]
MKKHCPCVGVVLIVVGVLFGLTTLNIVSYDFVQFWPVLLVLMGVKKIMHGCCKDKECCKK